MARSDAERTANEESEDSQSSVGTDPARTPHEQGKHKEQVALDEEKVEEHEREKQREEETPEERAARVKSA
jgi:hypothetical protein